MVTEIVIRGITFSIEEDKPQGIAYQVWPSARRLAAKLLETDAARNQQVLELGAG